MSQRPGRFAPERRILVRYPAVGGGRIIRDADPMRVGFDAMLVDVSATGVGMVIPERLELDEFVTVELENQVQRFHKSTRGRVRHCTETSESRWNVGVELVLRLTPLEVSLLRMGMHREKASGPRWI